MSQCNEFNSGDAHISRLSGQILAVTTEIAKARTASHDYVGIRPPLNTDERLWLLDNSDMNTGQIENIQVGIACSVLRFAADRLHDEQHLKRVHEQADRVAVLLVQLGRNVSMTGKVETLRGPKSSPFIPQTIHAPTSSKQHRVRPLQ